MKNIAILATGLVVVLSAGCATKKFVVKTVDPVQQRVAGAENRNSEQDKALGAHDAQFETVDRDLSRTKEKLGDTDVKATQAGEAAKAADQKAGVAQQSADQARQTADSAVQGLGRLDHTMQGLNKFNMAKSEAILFAVNRDTLTEDAKTQLNDLANQVKSLNRYVIEVQGFTDKRGSSIYNEALSERRARAVARYLANQYQIPLRDIAMLGSGYAQPVGDDKTADGRKINRRVEVRLWVPEVEAKPSTGATNQ